MRPHLRARWTELTLPPAGTRLVLDEVDEAGCPTGRVVPVVVASEPRNTGSSTPRMRAVALEALTEPPHLCLCGHVRVLHAQNRGPCTLCGDAGCSAYEPRDLREELL